MFLTFEIAVKWQNVGYTRQSYRLISLNQPTKEVKGSTNTSRGGSRVSRREAWTCFGRGGGADLQCRRFSVKMCVKMKELGPIGGSVHRKILYVDPPMTSPTCEQAYTQQVTPLNFIGSHRVISNAIAMCLFL